MRLVAAVMVPFQLAIAFVPAIHPLVHTGLVPNGSGLANVSRDSSAEHGSQAAEVCFLCAASQQTLASADQGSLTLTVRLLEARIPCLRQQDAVHYFTVTNSARAPPTL